MIPALVSTATAAVVGGLVFASGVLLARRWSAGRVHVAIAYGLGAIGAVSFAVFLAYWASPRAGVLLSFVLIGASLVHLGMERAWQYWRLVLPLVTLAGGILLTYLAILGFRASAAGDFYLVREFTSGFTQTPDNLLSFLVSDRLANGLPTHDFLDNWNGSDRPPLLAGFILLVRGVAAPVMGAQNAAFGASVIGQLLWVPALYSFLRAWGFSRSASLPALLLVAATGSTLVNTLYTWPKLMAAAFVLASCALLLDAIRRRQFFARNFVGAVALFVFAVLSHGAAGFTLPLVVGLGIAAYRGQRPRRIVATTVVAGAVGLLVYLPWMLYQRFADPPGDRLLKWHLAGVVNEDSRTFIQALADAYGSLTPGEWVAARLANIAALFDPRVFDSATNEDPLHARVVAETYTTAAALGIAAVLVVVVAVLVAIRSIRSRSVVWADRRFLLLVAASLACILFWCFLMFLPGSTAVHQGSHVWLLVLTVASIGWIATRHRRIALALVVLQFIATIVLYLPRDGGVDPAAIPVALVGLLAVVVGSFGFVRPRSLQPRGAS